MFIGTSTGILVREDGGQVLAEDGGRNEALLHAILQGILLAIEQNFSKVEVMLGSQQLLSQVNISDLAICVAKDFDEYKGAIVAG